MLEDFKEWEHYQAVQMFYQMLRWLNGPDSHLESNDCALDGPHENTIEAVDKPVTCGGRLMLFFRELQFNTSAEKVRWLLGALQFSLSKSPGNELVFIQIQFFETLFTQLPGTQFGNEVVLEFWSWGDTEQEAMENFLIIVSNLFDAVRQVSAKIHESLTEVDSKEN